MTELRDLLVHVHEQFTWPERWQILIALIMVISALASMAR